MIQLRLNTDLSLRKPVVHESSRKRKTPEAESVPSYSQQHFDGSLTIRELDGLEELERCHSGSEDLYIIQGKVSILE